MKSAQQSVAKCNFSRNRRVKALTGTEQVRYYLLEGDKLTVTTAWAPSLNFEGRIVQGILTWVKVR